MFTIILIASISVFHFASFAYPLNKDDNSSRYSQIIDYIKSDAGIKWYMISHNADSLEVEFAVSDSSVFLPYEVFYEGVLFSGKDKPKGNYSDSIAALTANVTDSLKNIDAIRLSLNEVCKRLSCLSFVNDSKFTLFLSVPYKNTIAAEVLYDPDKKRNYSLTAINNLLALKYLFIFDESDKIIKVYVITHGFS